MPEATLHSYLCWAEIGIAVPTLLALLFVSAPYGRHMRDGWGPSIPSRVGWILMELPAVALVAGVFAIGEHRAETAPLVLLAFWQLHYVHRTSSSRSGCGRRASACRCRSR